MHRENDYRNPSNSKVISALQELMCDKDFCTLYSLFVLALARKELSACSFRLFIGESVNDGAVRLSIMNMTNSSRAVPTTQAAAIRVILRPSFFLPF